MARLSIGIPVRNGARHLGATLDSLLGQTWGDFELIVSDNASDDGTPDLVADYARTDSRVRLIRQPVNLGANENYNAVARMGSGELFKWAAHDDVCAPTYLQEVVGLLDEHRDCVLAHSATELIDDTGAPLAPHGDQLITSDGSVYDHPDRIGAQRRLTDPRVSVRFRDILLGSAWCFEIFGVFRRDALMTTPLQRGFYGTDKVLLAELALRGTIRHAEQPLWQRRCHAATSTNLGLWQKVRWADPSARVPLPPVLRMVSGYLVAPTRVPLPLRDRVACWGGVAVAAIQPDKFQKLLLPGPYNYLGWHTRRDSTSGGATTMNSGKALRPQRTTHEEDTL